MQFPDGFTKINCRKIGIRMPNWSVMGSQKHVLCERLRQLGIARNREVRLYGQVFELVAEPTTDEDGVVWVEARERLPGRIRRISIPISMCRWLAQQVTAA